MRLPFVARSVSTSIVAAVIIWGAAPAVEATPIVDQSCCSGQSTLSVSFGSLTRAQTFTVGVGGMLTEIDVQLSLILSGSVHFDVVPGFTAGATVASLGTPLTSFDFSWPLAGSGVFVLNFPDVAVTAGQLLALVQRPTSSRGGWFGSNTDVYAGGEGLSTVFGSLTTFTNDLGPVDFAFRTFVEPGSALPLPVPEPAALTLVASVFLGATARYRAIRHSNKP